jgi:sugar phosphate isomerase/epimerase
VNRVTSAHRRIVRTGLATGAALAVAATGLVAGPAGAHPGHDKGPHADDCAGRVPVGKISIQMFSYFGWTNEVGIEPVLAELSEIGYRNIEPFAFGPTGWGGLSGEELRDLTRSYGIKVPTSHGGTNEATFDASLAYADAVGQKYVGSGGFALGGIRAGMTYDEVVAVAESLDRLGERSVRNGTGKVFGHNHQQEFLTTVVDPATGETKTAWEVIAEHTDPRWVTFQLDVFWAADAGVDVVDLLERYGRRIELLHIKDGFLNGPGAEGPNRGTPTDVGEGELDWEPILDAAKGYVKLYIVERDGAPADAEFARDSFRFLTCSD